ncbi:uncharacterized protein LOC126670220 [Mercurialis annua]|uniref:uncharacterized protein LOC126670220 n=1 Tax=Mercurialis annua TaxID=3986 RepID=UPI00215E2257|nr:uncharacterized protein LOC126670220 [Mercurialis annua]
MNVTRKAWMVAASIGAVEALKDQGICRWNYTLRSVQQHAKNNLRSFSSAASSSSSAANAVSNEISNAMLKKKEEACMEKVMGLSCFGPSTVRF